MKINIVLASLSILGEAFMLISYLALPQLRQSLTIKLIMRLTFFDLMTTVSDFLFIDYNNDIVC